MRVSLALPAVIVGGTLGKFSTIPHAFLVAA
jgi:hypothetical protein